MNNENELNKKYESVKANILSEYENEKTNRIEKIKAAIENANIVEKISFITNSSTYNGVFSFLYVLVSLIMFFSLVVFFKNDTLAVTLLSLFFVFYMATYYISIHFIEKNNISENDLIGGHHSKYIFMRKPVSKTILNQVKLLFGQDFLQYLILKNGETINNCQLISEMESYHKYLKRKHFAELISESI